MVSLQRFPSWPYARASRLRRLARRLLEGLVSRRDADTLGDSTMTGYMQAAGQMHTPRVFL